MARSLVPWLLMPLLCLGGCYRYFRVPEAPADPVEVWFTHVAFHKGIVLPTGDGGYEEWGMGEWRWYAQEANAWYDAPRAVLWPSMAALSRRRLPYLNADGMRRRESGLKVLEFDAERSAVAALRSQLEAMWDAGVTLGAGDATLLAETNWRGEEFVPWDEGYWMFWNCNDAAAAWLEALGCRVGSAVQSWGLVPLEPVVADAGRRPVRTYLAPPPGGSSGSR